MSGEYQLIPARHGTATFVPRNHTILIRNTYGKQVVDTWAFALNAPPKEKPKPKPKEKPQAKEKVQYKESPQKKQPESSQDSEEKDKEKVGAEEAKDLEKLDSVSKGNDTAPSEKTEKTEEDGSKTEEKTKNTPEKKAGWSSYLPSLPSIRGAKDTRKSQEQEEAKQENTRTWSQYLQSGKGVTSYLPSSDSLSLSAFASSHYRDPTKSYAEQLYDFSKTPVGAAGLSAATGSGYAGSIYAAYSAYSSQAGDDHPPMEFLSMAHTHTSTGHFVPKVGDKLVSNLREPLLTVLEDTTPGTHDTLIAACDPQRYKELGVEKWEEHGSCAENLVLALKELNEKSGLKGTRAIGADVTVYNVPSPLNLFMNVEWDDNGKMEFKTPSGNKNEYVKFKAEKDLVVVMSACPMDITPINGKKPMVGHFMVEVPQDDRSTRPSNARKTSARPPAKLNREASNPASESAKQPVAEEPARNEKAVNTSVPSTPKSPAQPAKKKPKKLERRSGETPAAITAAS